MSTLSNNPKLGADDRYELASRALMQQRQSRPTHLVVLGVLVLVAAIIALSLAWRYNNAAAKSFRKNQIAGINIERMILQINELQEAQSNSTVEDQFAPISDILTRFTRIGELAKLENEIKIPAKTNSRDEGSARLMIYEYNIVDSSLENILQWIQLSQSRIPGLEVRGLTITLNAQNWIVRVILTRYERIE